MGIPSTSRIYDIGIYPTTRTITSMKTRIYSQPFNSPTPGTPFIMAAVSNFTGGNSTRTVEEIRGIGFGDIILDLAAGETTFDDISISRAAFFGENLLQAAGFAGGVDGLLRSLQGVRYPIDLQQEILGFQIAPGSGSTLSAYAKSASQWYDDPLVEYQWAQSANQPTTFTSGGGADGTADAGSASKTFYNQYSSKSPIGDSLVTTTPDTLADDTNATVTLSVIAYVFENCWITSWNKGDFASNGTLITETMGLKYTRITNGSGSYWTDLQNTAFTFGQANS